MAKRLNVSVDDLGLSVPSNVEDEYELAGANDIDIDQLSDVITKFLVTSGQNSQLVRGDAVWLVKFNYKNNGRFFWDGEKVIPQQVDWLVTPPITFLVPTEFEPNHFDQVDNDMSYIWFDLPSFKKDIQETLKFGDLGGVECVFATIRGCSKSLYVVFIVDTTDKKKAFFMCRKLLERDSEPIVATRIDKRFSESIKDKLIFISVDEEFGCSYEDEEGEDAIKNGVKNKVTERICRFFQLSTGKHKQNHTFVGASYRCEECRSFGCIDCLMEDGWQARVRDGTFLCRPCYRRYQMRSDLC